MEPKTVMNALEEIISNSKRTDDKQSKKEEIIK